MRFLLPSVQKCSIPANTMLEYYLTKNTYTDCYTTEVSGQVSFSEYICAFYTTFLFKLELLILKLFLSKPSTDETARQLANGNVANFAAWTVERRDENELLMCDFMGRTRSWFMIIPKDGVQTRLYFGSAVLPKRNATSIEFGFRAVFGFHQIYSVYLLYFARARLRDQISKRMG